MRLLEGLVGVVTGVVSGFGVGGGSLLVLYLTLLAGVSQYTAGGINLLYFIGCAPAALVGHIRQKNVEWSAVLWCGLAGVLAAVPLSLVAAHVQPQLLHRLFGGVLLYIGVRELKWKPRPAKGAEPME